VNAVIDETYHQRLLKDKERVCEVAGLQPKYLMESMTTYCGSVEVEWVTQFRQHRASGTPGLILTAMENPDSRCGAICGALITDWIVGIELLQSIAAVPVRHLRRAARGQGSNDRFCGAYHSKGLREPGREPVRQ